MLFSSNNNTRKRSNLHWISTEIYGTRNVVHQTVRIGILMLLVSLPKKSDAVYHILFCPVCGSGVFNHVDVTTNKYTTYQSHRSLSFRAHVARNHGIHGKLLVDNRAETRPSPFVYAKLNRIANKISLQYLFDIFV